MKIPKGGYIYIIKREMDIPFDNSRGAVVIDNDVFDVIPGQKNTPLTNISDFVINIDNSCFEKVQPGKELYYADKFGEALKIKINQLMFG